MKSSDLNHTDGSFSVYPQKDAKPDDIYLLDRFDLYILFSYSYVNGYSVMQQMMKDNLNPLPFRMSTNLI